jgi:hypothetical protein
MNGPMVFAFSVSISTIGVRSLSQPLESPRTEFIIICVALSESPDFNTALADGTGLKKTHLSAYRRLNN